MNRVDYPSSDREPGHGLFKTGNCSDLGDGVQLFLA